MSNSNFSLDSLRIGVGAQDRQLSINHVIKILYEEDIKQSSTHLEITVTDSESGFISGLQGMEPLVISYSDNAENTHTALYTVYDIQDRGVTGDGKSKATLMCCSQELIQNSAMKLSRRFGKGEGKLVSDIVAKDILENILRTPKQVFAQPTKNKISFISPYWCPLTIIKWLCGRSMGISGSGQNASAGYCFYENMLGYFFKSFDSFSTEVPRKAFIVGYDPAPNEDMGGKIPVDAMKVVSSSDVIKGLNLGSYSSNVMTLDLKDMKYTEYPFNINEYYEKIPRLNPNTPLPSYYAAFQRGTAATRIMSKVVDTALFTEGTHTQDFTKQISQSALREKLFYNKQVEVSYIGDLDLYVGDVVELFSYKGKSREKDKQNSGKYVVGKIAREFVSRTDNMKTMVTLYTDSPGIE